METIEIGLREKKVAQTKLDILFAATEDIGNSSFNDLHVDEICDRAGISKVTFFKYFPQKDDILLYFLRTWCLKRAIDLYHHPREGMQGIYFVFDKMAQTYEKTPGLLLSLISYYTSLPQPPAPFPLRKVERHLMFPNEKCLDSIQINSIPQMFERFILEAIFYGEVTSSTHTRELARSFVSLLYGSIITAHIEQIKPMKPFFRRNIDNLLKGLK